MTGLLVSVRSAAEATVAAEAGAAIIDVKEPHRGALGAADAKTIDEIAAAVGRHVPLSVALGELEGSESRPVWQSRVQFAKLGLAGCARLPDWQSRWKKAIDELPEGTQPVAVVYADWRAAAAPQPEEVLRAALTFGCRAVLIDTFDKRGQALFELWQPARLRRFAARVRERGMLIVLAGSLDERSLRQALTLDVDFVAVRGAACRDGRQSEIDARRLRRLVRLCDSRESIVDELALNSAPSSGGTSTILG